MDYYHVNGASTFSLPKHSSSFSELKVLFNTIFSALIAPQLDDAKVRRIWTLTCSDFSKIFSYKAYFLYWNTISFFFKRKFLSIFITEYQDYHSYRIFVYDVNILFSIQWKLNSYIEYLLISDLWFHKINEHYILFSPIISSILQNGSEFRQMNTFKY